MLVASRYAWVLAFLFVGCKSSGEKKTIDPMGAAPPLKAMHEFTFLAPFGCGSTSNAGSGFFLTDEAKSNNRPHMVLIGDCATKPIFKIVINNPNMGLIADLGNVPIEEVTVPKAFNFTQQGGKDSVFKTEAVMDKNKTYAVIFTEPALRTLMVFKVSETGGDDKAYKNIKIRYMFLDYLAQQTTHAATDPTWGKAK